jgi:hypothetical protein
MTSGQFGSHLARRNARQLGLAQLALLVFENDREGAAQDEPNS